MDFVERIFGVTPDGGSGALEAAILCAVILASTVAPRVIRAVQKLRVR